MDLKCQNDLGVERVLAPQSDRQLDVILASCRTPQAEASEVSGQPEPPVVNDSSQLSISTTVPEGQESPVGDISNEHCEVSNTRPSVGGDGTSSRQETLPLPPPPPTQVRLPPLQRSRVMVGVCSANTQSVGSSDFDSASIPSARRHDLRDQEHSIKRASATEDHLTAEHIVARITATTR